MTPMKPKHGARSKFNLDGRYMSMDFGMLARPIARELSEVLAAALCGGDYEQPELEFAYHAKNPLTVELTLPLGKDLEGDPKWTVDLREVVNARLNSWLDCHTSPYSMTAKARVHNLKFAAALEAEAKRVRHEVAVSVLVDDDGGEPQPNES